MFYVKGFLIACIAGLALGAVGSSVIAATGSAGHVKAGGYPCVVQPASGCVRAQHM